MHPFMRFCFEQHVRLPIEVVFGFFQNPSRLEELYEGRPRIRLLHYEKQVRIGAQTWVEACVARCIPVVLGFRHHRYEAPVRFGEEAVHGPFSKFVHLHEFEVRAGGTLMRDLLEICLPWYYGGEWAMRRIVAPMINQMFAKRGGMLNRLVERGVLGCEPGSVGKEN